jgi:hypothetical protein
MQTDVEQRMKPYKFNVGDKVWLQAKQIKVHPQSAKLGPKQLGPFEVTEVRSDVDYKLALPPALRIHDVFHVDRLSPYKGNEVNGQVPPPPEPVTVEGEEEYEVDHIRDSKLFGRTLKYLVRWTGYGEGEDTWEPAKNLEHAQDKVLEFYSKNPGAPRKLAANLYASLPWQNPTQFTEVSQFPLALSPKTKRTRSYTSYESTHVTSGVNTRQTPSDLTGIRTTEITAWQLDALSSRDRRGSGRRGLSRRSGRVDILDLHQGR